MKQRVSDYGRAGCFLLPLVLILAAGCAREAVLSSDPEVLLEAGWADFRLAEYDLAVKKFTTCRELPGLTEDQRLLALYGLATTWNLRQPLPDQDKKLARALYGQIVAEAPRHDLAAWSMLALARMNHLVPVGQDPDYEKVRLGYQEVIDAFPEHIAGQEAFIYQQSTLIMTLDPDTTRPSLEKLEAFVSEHPESRFVSMACNLLAIGYETLGRYEDQLAARIKELESLEVDPTSPFADSSWRYWQIATTAEFQAGDFDVARKYYRLLVEEYPVDIRTYAAEQALERMDALEAELRAELEAGT
jgi:tetratricopeptide (TPR) repeat protein